MYCVITYISYEMEVPTVPGNAHQLTGPPYMSAGGATSSCLIEVQLRGIIPFPEC